MVSIINNRPTIPYTIACEAQSYSEIYSERMVNGHERKPEVSLSQTTSDANGMVLGKTVYYQVRFLTH